jgi:predicted ATP-grasp superfamily ATP-dependent carboligase
MNSSIEFYKKSKTTRPKILIVDHDRVPLTLAVIRCLGMQLPADIHLLSFSKDSFPVYRYSKYVKSFVNIPVEDEDRIFDTITGIAGKVKADVLLPIREYIIHMISKRPDAYRQHIALPPLPDERTIELIKNKWLLYDWLYVNKLSGQKPIRYADIIHDRGAVHTLEFPVLIKPFEEAGGAGITLVRDIKELSEFKPPEIYDPAELLIQKFIHGHDVDLSAIVKDGTVLAHTVQEGFGRNRGFAYSRQIRLVHNDELLQISKEIFRKLKYNGVAHLDFRYDTMNKSYTLVDFNGRFWGTLTGSLYAGINFPVLAYNLARGIDFSSDPVFRDTKYSTEINPLKVFLRGFTFRNSDITYALKDPLPYFANLLVFLRFKINRMVRVFKKMNFMH